MGFDPVYYVRSTEAVPEIPELSVVALRAALILKDRRPLPAGSEGTVVGLWGDGRGYVVEFDGPFHAVATVEADQLREIVRFGG